MSTYTRVYCAQCKQEGRARPELLGRLERTDVGGLVWRSESKRRERLNPRGAQRASEGWRAWRAGVVLVHPDHPGLEIPPAVPAVCSQHGWGELSTAEVTAARGKFASLRLLPTA